MTDKVILRYQATLLLLTAVLLGLSIPLGLGSLPAVCGLAVVAAVAERGRVRLGDTTEVSISVLPTVFAAAALG
ncbi:MAG TPA: hypothetical protein VGM80_18280, partial [Gaiellaceae bacterium]